MGKPSSQILEVDVLRRFVFSVALLSLCSGCGSQQLYDTGQAYQRNQCLNMPDQAERERCLSRTDRRFDDYRRDNAYR